MSDLPVIRVEGLSKKYLLGQSKAPMGLRHAIEDLAKAPLRWMRGAKRSERTPAAPAGEFWALDDVSFEIKQGEVVGIIGRNGAGKSTLLKILSRITEPTRGRIGIKGRIASLLEVGTGFHPELTGRENIFLNGAILGMTRQEVLGKLDEIIAFAGIEKFLDTPVKRYSSGMYVRLAFAVAAHLEPEILVVDEVLAVGDAEFQKKCLGKMREATEGGRTVLFVSHNLPAVAALCTRGIYLKAGHIVMDGGTEEILQCYKNDFTMQLPELEPDHGVHRSGSGTHRFERVQPAAMEFPARGRLSFLIALRQYREEAPFHLSLHFRDEWDTEIFAINTKYIEGCVVCPGNQELELTVDSPWLPPGDYRVEAYLFSDGVIDHWSDVCQFRVGSDVATLGYSHASAANVGKVLASFRITETKRTSASYLAPVKRGL